VKFATGAIKAILSTPAEEQKCIRVEISKAIAGEAETCLRKKVPNFSGVPEIPDLEEGAFSIREQVKIMMIKGLKYRKFSINSSGAINFQRSN
jgi:hypothetical protein